MNTRIRDVRKQSSLSMKAFGDRIGISSPSVARLESGENNPSEQTIRAICSEFNVNRTWLETGEGEPYKQSVLIPELARVLSNAPALKAALERIVPLMTDEDWATLDRLLDRIAEDAKKEP